HDESSNCGGDPWSHVAHERQPRPMWWWADHPPGERPIPLDDPFNGQRIVAQRRYLRAAVDIGPPSGLVGASPSAAALAHRPHELMVRPLGMAAVRRATCAGKLQDLSA